MNSTSTAVSLESVLYTEQLARRASRAPDYESENRALVALTQALAQSPRTILQTLVETTLDVLRAGSAGISLLGDVDGGQAFHWPAIAGAWKPNVGGGMPRDSSPCGVVLDRNSVQLFVHPERYYHHLAPITEPICEALLAPFSIDGRATGTVWVLAHDEHRHFDAEDQRVLERLGTFAAAAYQSWRSIMGMEAVNRGLHAEVEQRQRAEDALREEDRRKSEFLAMLAHELRNPLAASRNAVQLLQRARAEGDVVDSMIGILDRQIGFMTRLVDDLVDVSRIRRGNLELRTERVELASVLRDAVEATGPLCTSMRHELTVSLPTQPIYLNADPARLSQIVGNLLNNACKFTEPGGHIRLTVGREGSHAVIAIQDNGIGIAEDQRTRVFEMFTQADTSLERSRSGLGIGLTLAKNLAEMHGGTIEVQSAGAGKGSVFAIRLPVLAEAQQSQSAAPPAIQPPTVQRRILVVDDNRDSATSLARLLTLSGHETHTAHDGLQAVKAAAELVPDVILLDIGLPGLNGYEAARRIRQQPGNRRTVLVALTGWGQVEDRSRSEEAGFDAHVVKPVNLAALTQLVAELHR